MAETLAYPQICRLLLGAVEQIRRHHEMLSRLDAAIGDGDHGTTLLRAMETVATAVSESAGPELEPLLSKAAWNIMACDGGSTGPLLGSFFLGMSEAVAGKTALDRNDVAAMFEAGTAKLQKQSRAHLGDKTMMDAFLPALEALKAALPTGDFKVAFQQAAQAAAAGAEATRGMRARFGRARHLGDRVLGHPDPGAVSASLIFQGFSEGLVSGS
jgi:phosphoenolpyruvate---glycerone phosphotransferase subunit DhaL